MEQKITWMHFLLFGISCFLILVLTGCKGGKIGEHLLDVDFEYINNSDSSILIKNIIIDSKKSSLLIHAGDYEVIVLELISGADKDPSPSTCCQGFLGDLHGGSVFIKYGDSLCVNYVREGLHLISNYQSQVIADRYYKFSYVFRDEDFKNVVPWPVCN